MDHGHDCTDTAAAKKHKPRRKSANTFFPLGRWLLYHGGVSPRWLLPPLFVLALSLPARAQDAAASLFAPPPTSTSAEASEGFHAADANGDRVVLLPTAKTQPKGLFTFSSYDVVLLQAGYAITDSTQLTLTFTPPVQGSMPLDFSLKTAFLRGPLVRAAAMASVTGLTGLGDVGFVFLGRAGAVVDFCFRSDCASSVTVGSNVTFAGAILFMWNGAGLVWRVSPHLALLAEADTLLPLGRALGQGNGLLAWGGLRVPGRSWSFDAALGYSPRAGDRPLALPLLILSYRPGA